LSQDIAEVQKSYIIVINVTIKNNNCIPKWKNYLTSILKNYPLCVYLATSDELQGLVAQGRTVAETLEIARDVARKLLEAQSQDQESDYLQPIING
jgi:hypothetical protein